MLVSQLEEEVNHLSRNVSFGLNILFVSNSRVARSTIKSLDSLVDESSIPINKVSLLSSKPLSSSLEENFELSNYKFNQLFWPYSNGKRDYSILSSLLNYDIIIITSGIVSLEDHKTNRFDSFRRNYPIIKNMALSLKGYKGFVILTSNPVDYLAEEFVNLSGVSPYQVIGVHTENIRLRKLIANEYNLANYSLSHIRVCTSSVHGKAVLIKSSLVLSYNNRFENVLDKDQVASLFDLVKSWPQKVLSSNEHTQNSTSSAIIEYIKAVKNYGNSFVNASVYMPDGVLSKISNKFDSKFLSSVNHFNGWFSYFNVKVNHSNDVRLESPLFLIRSEPFDFNKISPSNKVSLEDKINLSRAVEASSKEYSLFKSKLYLSREDSAGFNSNFHFLDRSLFLKNKSVFISQDTSVLYDGNSMVFYFHNNPNNIKIVNYLNFDDYLASGFKHGRITSMLKLDDSSYVFSHSLAGLVYINLKGDSPSVRSLFSCDKEALPCNIGGLAKSGGKLFFYRGKSLFEFRLNPFNSSFNKVYSFNENLTSLIVVDNSLLASTKHSLFKPGRVLNVLYYNPLVHIKGSSASCDKKVCFVSLLCKSSSFRHICSFHYNLDEFSLVGRSKVGFPAHSITSLVMYPLVYSDTHYTLFSYGEFGVSPLLSG